MKRRKEKHKVVSLLLCCLFILLAAGCQKKPQDEDSSLNTDGATITGAADTQTPAPSGTPVPEPETSATPSPTEALTEEGFYAGKTEKEFIQLAENYAEQLGKENYNKLYQDFSDEMKEGLDENGLKTIWEAEILLAGDYKKVEKELTKATIFQEYGIVAMILKYEKAEILVQMTFNQELEIAGFFKRPYSNEITPTEPPVMDEREQEIKIGDGEYALDGILTIPDGIEKPPVVILIQGSGQSDMDESIGSAGNKPFRDLAVGLADLGIATIRYNKRFYQYPELADETLTIYEEVLLDAKEAIQFAKNEERLDGERIYVLGHSLGGMMAPKIAADHAEVAGIISLAGTPRHLEELIYDQNIALIQNTETFSDEEREELIKAVQTMKEQAANVTEETLAEPVFGVSGYYWKSLNEIDQAALAQELQIPMLFLQGEADFQVYSEVDFKLWQELLEGKESVAFRLYPELNHLFMKSSGLQSTADYDIPGTVEPEVIQDIAAWIQTGVLPAEAKEKSN